MVIKYLRLPPPPRGGLGRGRCAVVLQITPALTLPVEGRGPEVLILSEFVAIAVAYPSEPGAVERVPPSVATNARKPPCRSLAICVK